MTQIATVEKIYRNGRAQISVPRKSACGHDCEECAGCGVSGTSVYAEALNPIGAQPGQKVVVVEDLISTGGSVLEVVDVLREAGAEVLGYIVPVILFFLGYFLPGASVAEGVRVTAAIAAFCISIIPAVLFDRHVKRKGSLQFTIVKLF